MSGLVRSNLDPFVQIEQTRPDPTTLANRTTPNRQILTMAFLPWRRLCSGGADCQHKSSERNLLSIEVEYCCFLYYQERVVHFHVCGIFACYWQESSVPSSFDSVEDTVHLSPPRQINCLVSLPPPYPCLRYRGSWLGSEAKLQ